MFPPSIIIHRHRGLQFSIFQTKIPFYPALKTASQACGIRWNAISDHTFSQSCETSVPINRPALHAINPYMIAIKMLHSHQFSPPISPELFAGKVQRQQMLPCPTHIPSSPKSQESSVDPCSCLEKRASLEKSFQSLAANDLPPHPLTATSAAAVRKQLSIRRQPDLARLCLFISLQFSSKNSHRRQHMSLTDRPAGRPYEPMCVLGARQTHLPPHTFQRIHMHTQTRYVVSNYDQSKPPICSGTLARWHDDWAGRQVDWATWFYWLVASAGRDGKNGSSGDEIEPQKPRKVMHCLPV